jgi:hypothetical protein
MVAIVSISVEAAIAGGRDEGVILDDDLWFRG